MAENNENIDTSLPDCLDAYEQAVAEEEAARQRMRAPEQDANAVALVDMLDKMMDLDDIRKNIEKQLFDNIGGARDSFSSLYGFTGNKKLFSAQFAKFRDENLIHILGPNHKRIIIHRDYGDLTSRLRISSRKKKDSEIAANVQQASEASDENRRMVIYFRATYGGGAPENDISWVKTLIQKHNTYYAQFVSKLKCVFYFALFNETWSTGGKKKNKNNSNQQEDVVDDVGDDEDQEDEGSREGR
jgi:hypothetical protein